MTTASIFFWKNENYNADEELEEPVFLANANSCPLRERRELLMHAFSIPDFIQALTISFTELFNNCAIHHCKQAIIKNARVLRRKDKRKIEIHSSLFTFDARNIISFYSIS